MASKGNKPTSKPSAGTPKAKPAGGAGVSKGKPSTGVGPSKSAADFKQVKPGQKTPQSGIYKPTKGGSEVALSKGDRVPPTRKGGSFVLKTPTRRRGPERQVGGDWSGSPPPPPPKNPK
jgi:hypothetical protein